MSHTIKGQVTPTHTCRKVSWRQDYVEGLLQSPSPQPSHLMRTRRSVHTKAVREEGPYSGCTSPASTKPPMASSLVPRSLHEEKSLHTPHHCCPSQQRRPAEMFSP